MQPQFQKHAVALPSVIVLTNEFITRHNAWTV
jgi:hypothetical protein